MAIQASFVNEKTKKKYPIVSISEDGATVTLQGPNRKFNEPLDKARLKQLGYKLVREEVEEVEDETED